MRGGGHRDHQHGDLPRLLRDLSEALIVQARQVAWRLIEPRVPGGEERRVGVEAVLERVMLLVGQAASQPVLEQLGMVVGRHGDLTQSMGVFITKEMNWWENRNPLWSADRLLRVVNSCVAGAPVSIRLGKAQIIEALFADPGQSWLPDLDLAAEPRAVVATTGAERVVVDAASAVAQLGHGRRLPRGWDDGRPGLPGYSLVVTASTPAGSPVGPTANSNDTST